jgi:hypothetical protein
MQGAYKKASIGAIGAPKSGGSFVTKKAKRKPTTAKHEKA